MMDVGARFLDVAKTAANATAVVDGEVEWSYQRFAALVAEIQRAIETEKRDRIAIAIDQGVLAYAAIMAALISGVNYLPLNVRNPAGRLQKIIDLFAPQAMLVENRNANGIADLSNAGSVIEIGGFDGSSDMSPQLRSPQEAAYTIFTSGSTGIPKGVLVGRKGLSTYTSWAIDHLQLAPGERITQQPNIGFDLSVIEIFGGLCSGATLVAFNTEISKMFPSRFARENGITVWVSVPSVIDGVRLAGKKYLSFLSGIRVFFFCGEPLKEHVLELIFSENADARVVNAYGPTEATVSCTALDLTAENYRCYLGATASFGSPIDGIALSFVGGNDDEGELVISGEQVAFGYWRDEDRTWQCFGVDSQRGTRSYRTGDWVKRRKSDGAMFFSHRIDHQVKVRGYRVELGEIEAVIRKYFKGANVAVIAQDDEIYAYVETASLGDMTDLRRQLGRELPEYMLPRSIYGMEKFPRTGNDKIDTQALKDWSRNNDSAHRSAASS